MKKFLSVLLAVMMILSTVSFAAPSAVVAGDSASVLPAEDAFLASDVTDNATLAATLPLEDAKKGTLILNADFENPSTDGEVDAWPKLSRLGAQTNYPENVDFHITLGNNSMITGEKYIPGDHLNDNTIYGTESGNRYLVTKRGAVGYAQYDIYNINGPYNKICDNGIYTLEVDARFVDTVPESLKARFVNGRKVDGAWVGNAQDFKDVDVAVTDAANFHTYTFVCDTTKLDKWAADEYLGAIQFFTQDNEEIAGYMHLDNIKIYWKPATVKVTVAGNDYTFATTGVSANDIEAKIETPTGYTVDGVYYDADFNNKVTGTVYFTKDTTLYTKYVKDTNVDATYGKKLLSLDFDNIDFTADQESETFISYYLSNIAKYYNASMITTDSDLLQFYKPDNGIPSLVTNGTGKALKFAINGAWNNIAFVKQNGSKWGKGTFTIAFDLSTVSATGFAISQSSTAFTVVDPYAYTADTYDRVVITVDKDYLTDKNSFQLQFNTALTEVKVDNLEIFWKPESANVTLVYGTDEYKLNNISTSGVSASNLVSQAGISVPYGKKAVLSATKGGESVGDTVYLVGDSKYYVSFAKDDNTSETYGQRVFLIDFEKFANDHVLVDNLNVSTLSSYYNDKWTGLTINWEVGSNEVKTVDGNKVIRGGQGWSQFRVNNKNYETDPTGVYTIVADTYNFGTETVQFSATNQGAVTENEGELISPKDKMLTPKTWHTVVGQWTTNSDDMSMYWNGNKDQVGDVAFDNISLYYKPATVDVTVVAQDGTKTVKTGVSTDGVAVSSLTDGMTAPFGYKVALSAEKNGESLGDTVTIVADATLYVIYVEDKSIDLKKGSLLINADFENPVLTAQANAWPQVKNLGATVTGLDETATMHFGIGDRSLIYGQTLVIGEHLNDNTIFGSEDGNRYLLVKKNAAAYTQYDLYNATGPYNRIHDNGVYTFELDARFVGATAEVIKIRFTNDRKEDGNWKGSSVDFVDVDVPVTDSANFHTYSAQVDTSSLEKWATTEALSTVQFFAVDSTNTAGYMHIDNVKLYWKPAKATVNFTIDGVTVATKTDVATTGVLVSDLLNGVKATGYNVGTTVKLGKTSYSSTETVVLPGNCSVELDSATKLSASLIPESKADNTSVRAGDVSGVRFMAKLDAGAQSLLTEYGWIVTRKEILMAYEKEASDFTYDLINQMVADEEDGFKWVAGKNYVKDEVDAKIWKSDDTSIFFTAVLYNIPEDKYEDVLIARPYTLEGDADYEYGTAIEVSVKSVCQTIKDGGYDGLSESQKAFVDSVLA